MTRVKLYDIEYQNWNELEKIADEILEEYPDCPIVNCNVDNIKEKLAWLIENPEERIRIGKAGRAFVEKHCDAKKVNEAVLNIYNELLNIT